MVQSNDVLAQLLRLETYCRRSGDDAD